MFHCHWLATSVLCSAAAATLAVAVTQDPPTAAQLVAEGWTLIPTYEGRHRTSLDETTRRRTAAAAHIFAAACELDPEHARALWCLGHAEVLLAEDARSRDRAFDDHVARAHAALSRGIEVDPSDPWAAYARGALCVEFGDPTVGLADLDRAVALAAPLLEERGPSSREAWLRFKALEWRPEAFMRAGRFDDARRALREFHGEFSTSVFPLHIALAECRLRERDLSGALAEYEAIVAAFPNDPVAYALLGYVGGLLEDRTLATRRLSEAIAREPDPGLYSRLWLWILASDEARPEAEEDLRAFVESPPSSLSVWDRRVGTYCLEGVDPQGFLDAARGERERRLDAGEVLDELICEAWFYVGVRHELVASMLDDAEVRRGVIAKALAAYRAALAARPTAWKWEWDFARLHLARLAATAEGSSARDGGHGAASARSLERERWHRPGSAGPVEQLFERRPGDLRLGVTHEPAGSGRYVVQPWL